MRYLRAPLAALLCLGLAQAQARTWRLPTGGLARYVSDEPFTPEPDGRLPGCALPHAPLLLQSELAAAGTHVAGEPQDWRWIAPYVAFDLRLPTSGKVATRLARVGGLGDLALTGTATTGADGRERYELAFVVEPVRLDAAEQKLAAADPRPWFGGSGRGRLRLDRHVDPARGVVDAFVATLELDVTLGASGQRAPLRGTLTQNWQLDAVIDHRAPDFPARVAAAITAGSAVVAAALRPDRPEFASKVDDPDHVCGEGRLALALQTLLAAEYAADDPTVRAGFAELQRRELRETYSLATALLATDGRFAPRGERDDLLAGRLAAPTPRVLPAEDQARVAAWATRLLQNRDATVDAAYRSRWWYLGGNGFDNSNTQYALLGLWSARLCRHDVGRGVWLAAAEHWLAVQHPPSGKPRGLDLTPLQAAGPGEPSPTRPARTGRTVAPRGFGYTVAGDGPAYGSMTCAGIAALSLCRAALDDGKRTPLDGRLDDAIRAGFAWLSAARSVRGNAGPEPYRREWFYYWLYSLERACELSRTGLIDGWDWYHDGAQVLLALQDADGRFGTTLEEQCFAVLFLKKAQLPVLTGPR